LGSSQINTWHVADYLNEILGVSSSLFSSPSKILPDHVLEDGTYFLTEGGLLEWEEPHSFIKHGDTHPPKILGPELSSVDSQRALRGLQLFTMQGLLSHVVRGRLQKPVTVPLAGL
jgi:hypothetical protein